MEGLVAAARIFMVADFHDDFPFFSGWRCYALLVRAFEGGHAFVVGQSVTTGQDNTVIWGTIHQKTNTHGGTGAHGWPDPTYVNRLVSECAAKGILEQ